MTLSLFFAIYAVLLIVTFSAGIWLLLHLTALARMVEGMRMWCRRRSGRGPRAGRCGSHWPLSAAGSS